MAAEPDEPLVEDELSDEEHSQERRDQVRRTLLTVLALVVGLGIVVAIGTTLMVRSLDLDEGATSSPVGSDDGDREPLPTTALPVPGESSSPSDTPTDLVTPEEEKRGPLQLDVSPPEANPMERVNLTGTYRGQDNLALQVQRFEDGRWADFGVSATVRVGTYETYVMTGRQGQQRFRMFDPQGDRASNEVTVTIR